MKNESGFATLIAILMMLMIAMAIMSVTNLATRQSQIYSYSRQELKLQNAAESAFNEVVANLTYNDEYYGAYSNNFKSFDLNVDNVKIKIFLRKREKTIANFPGEDKKTNIYVILIRALAEMPNYNYPLYQVYKRVYGYISRYEIDGVKSEYEFHEYLE